MHFSTCVTAIKKGGPTATHRVDETWPVHIWVSRLLTGQHLQLEQKLLLPLLEVSDPLLTNSTKAPMESGA